jgi:DNA-binding NtrC family response regulator
MSEDKKKEKKKRYRQRKKERKEKNEKEKIKEDLSLKLKNKLNSCRTKRTRDSYEHKSFRTNLRKNNGNVMKTMQDLNINEENLENLINKLNLIRK